MSGFPILDFVIGLIFIYFLLSIISSSVVEMILTWKGIRAKVLTDWLLLTFNKVVKKDEKTGEEETLGHAIMNHSATTALSKPNESPSYIDARNFTTALIETITYHTDPETVAKTIDDLTGSIEKSSLLSGKFRRTLLTYASEAKESYKNLTVKTMGEIGMFRQKVEGWYDMSMKRLTGPLKRHSRLYTIIVASSIAIFLNADSISIAKYLYNNPEARTKLAAKAYETGKDTAISAGLTTIQQLIESDSAKSANDTAKQTVAQVKANLKEKMEEINKANAALEGSIPIGWSKAEFQGVNSWLIFILSKIGGLVLTILAIFMGAPFWFDILNKISNMRGTGGKPAAAEPA